MTVSVPTPTKRKLNIEILRIFAMVLICFWHIHGHYMEDVLNVNPNANRLITYICLFITFHVDLFVMISGYFGIKRPTVNIIRTLFLCVFYALLLNCINIYLGNPFNWREIFFPISHSPWWFMRIYLCLILVAPVIEKFIKNSSDKEFYSLLAISTFLNVYMGFYLQLDEFYSHGYDLYNFINVYLLGVWLRKDKGIIKYFTMKWWIPVIVFFVCVIIRYKVQPITAVIWTDYNSPLNLIMAVCIFCVFQKIKVPDTLSKAVMFFSSSAIAVYLITDYQPFVQLMRPYFNSGYLKCGSVTWVMIYLFALISIVFFVCCLFDKIRIAISEKIINKPFGFRKETN